MHATSGMGSCCVWQTADWGGHRDQSSSQGWGRNQIAVGEGVGVGSQYWLKGFEPRELQGQMLLNSLLPCPNGNRF